MFGAFVEGHDDVRPQGHLNLDGSLGREEMRRAIEVRTEGNAFFCDLSQACQAENLESTGVGEQGPVPTHEAV